MSAVLRDAPRSERNFCPRFPLTASEAFQSSVELGRRALDHRSFFFSSVVISASGLLVAASAVDRPSAAASAAQTDDDDDDDDRAALERLCAFVGRLCSSESESRLRFVLRAL
eukprot:Amastigsp_a174667_196.p6 type:complete len:113 gc:universal Amastigsp_a174667_196:1024-1362(+)